MPGYPIDPSDRKPIGRTGETVSAIGLGTWGIRDYNRAFEAIVYAVNNGVDNIDTAEMYGDGLAEELVGKVLRHVGRDRVFVTTKLLPERFRSREAALKAARRSLRRMGIGSADLILIHWPDSLVSVEEQVRNLEAIALEGLTRYIGVSNFNKRQLEVAISSTKKHEIVVNQVKYSIVDRSVERESLLDFAIRMGITIQAYTPLERGMVAKLTILDDVAGKYGKTRVQVALNFLISRPRVVAIPKTESISHAKEIIGSMGWRLSGDDIELLERVLT